MQVKANRKELLDVVSKVKLAVPGKATLPIMQHFKLEAGRGRLTVTGGNLESFLIGSCEVKVGKAGAICVEAKPLEAFLKASSADEVVLIGKVETKEVPGVDHKYNPDTKLYEDVEVMRTKKTISFKIEAGAATATLESNDPIDYPPVPKVKGKAVKIAAFAQAIGRVSYAMATEESRPVLSGLCLRQRGNKIEVAAADGFQLAIAPVKAVGRLKEDAIFPLKTVGLIRKLMQDITFRYEKGEHYDIYLLESNDLKLVTQGISGTFPAYEQLIPKNGTILTANTAELKEAVKLIMASDPDYKIIRLQTVKGELVVSSQHDDNDIEVKVAARGKIKIAFDRGYLSNLLAQAGEDITLRTTAPKAPALMKTQDSTHCVMPMFVQW